MWVNYFILFKLILEFPGNVAFYPGEPFLTRKLLQVPISAANRTELQQQHNILATYRNGKHTAVLSIMLMMGVCNVVGDLVRHISIPYPILFMAGGGLLGWYSDISRQVEDFLQVTGVHPRVLLMIFLPAFVFRTAYNIDTRLFTICLWQILLVGIVGVMVSSLLVGVLILVIFKKYDWSFENSFLFGAIVSTTYPHVTINILQDKGLSKPLCVLLEGENVIRDAFAMMVFYMLIYEIISPNRSVWMNVLDVFLYWFVGALIGIVLGKTITFCTQKFFTDVNQLILITFSVTYLTFYFCEDYEDYSGVVAVASIGMVMGRAKNSFASNMGKSLSDIWEILCRACETIVFVLIGLMAVKSLQEVFDWHRVLLAFTIYIISNVCRIVVYLVLLPMLSRLGSGLSWQNAIVAMWGGLHGILSMLLALMAARTSHFVHIGPQFSILVTMIVILTYLINGSSITVVLSKLGLLTVSSSRRANMRKALANLHDVRERHFNFLKLAKYFPVVNWKFVDEATTIVNPYFKHGDKEDKDIEIEQNLQGPRMTVCPNCQKVHFSTLAGHEMRELRRMVQLKMLQARKAFYWRQLQRGMISKNGALFLVACVENALAKEMMSIDINEIKALWREKRNLKFYKYCFKRLPIDQAIRVADVTDRWRIKLFKISTRKSFVLFYYVIIVAQLFTVTLEFIVEYHVVPGILHVWFDLLNVVYFLFYAAQIYIKVGVFGFNLFTRETMNIVELFLLGTMFLSIIFDFVFYLRILKKPIDWYLVYSNNVLRLLNFIRMFRFFQVFIPLLRKYSYVKIQECMYEAFEVSLNFVWGEEQIIFLLDFLISFEELHKELWSESGSARFEMMRLLAKVQMNNPSCGINVKTKNSIRGTLFYLKQYVRNLKERDGLLDNQEFTTLVNQIGESLRNARKVITAESGHVISSIITSVPWIAGNEDLACFIEEHGTMLKYDQGEQVYMPRQIPLNVYIVISGTLEVHLRHEDCMHEARVPPGRLPVVDHLTNLDWKQVHRQGRYEEFVEILALGVIIGELGFLTGRQYNSRVTCDSALEVLCISAYQMIDAIKKFQDETTGLKSLMWKTMAARFVPYIIAKMSTYQDLTLDAIVWLVARALVVALRGTKTLVVTGVVKELVLLEGQVRDKEGNHYFGPTCLPHITEVTPAYPEDIESCKLLVIPEENVGECYIIDEDDQMKVEPVPLVKCPLHTLKIQNPEEEEDLWKIDRSRETLDYDFMEEACPNGVCPPDTRDQASVARAD
ncbi:sodium/hydrogen exchanger 10-like [Bacillus rossius redtenbacheri]|uniref:sodium/hydrogen exchanger 10-like n=1 Tax=Bacillus rossius redtenbacheri TaxID=93214 RepID=UPI002FDCEAD1